MIQEIKDIKVQPRTIDLASSGQGKQKSAMLVGDGVVLLNNIEYTHYDENEFQAILCGSCAIIGCQAGGWVSLRRLGEYVAIVPAAYAMQDDAFDAVHYAPPSYLITAGAMTLSSCTYDKLQAELQLLPPIQAIKPIDAFETLAVLKITAPGNVLGKLAEPTIVLKDSFLAVSEGDLDHELQALQDAIESTEKTGGPYHSAKPDRVVEFHLDLPNYPTWAGLGYSNNKPMLILK